MKRLIPVLLLLTAAVSAVPANAQGIFAPAVTPSGPLVDVVNAIVTAFNNQDKAYFQKVIAPGTVWLDEDGHHLNGQVWINRMLSANPARKLTISNLRVSNWDDAGWAGFNYVIEGTNRVKGVNSLVFKKTGNDWQVVLIHGAVDTPAVAH
jgi:hypothetical protein